MRNLKDIHVSGNNQPLLGSHSAEVYNKCNEGHEAEDEALEALKR